MKVVTTIAVPSFVYQFYMKAANEIGNKTPEDVMADALFTYAGMIAQDILHHQSPDILSSHPNSDNPNP